jgi:hypothetical protein
MFIKMTKSVATVGRALNEGEEYDIDHEAAEEYIRLGWAIRVREAAAKSPAKRKATKKRVSKR